MDLLDEAPSDCNWLQQQVSIRSILTDLLSMLYRPLLGTLLRWVRIIFHSLFGI